MKIIVNVLIIVFLLTLQWAILPFCGLNFLFPPLILPVVIAWSETGRLVEALIWGMSSIFLWDILSSASGKIMAAAVVAFVAVYFGLRHFIHLKKRTHVFICVSLTSILFFAIYNLLWQIFGQNFWEAFAGTLLPSFALGLFFWLFYPFLSWFAEIVAGWEAGRKSLLR